MGALKTETLIVAGIALALIYMARKAADTAAEAANAINPLNNNNVFSQAANSLWQMSTGSKGTIGTDIYDYVHKAEPLPDGSLLNYTPAQQAADQKATSQLELGFHGM